MDVSAIASAATALSQARLASQVEVALLRKALGLQGEGVLQLVQALPAVNPPHTGNGVDTFA